jgi:hypothetical protein
VSGSGVAVEPEDVLGAVRTALADLDVSGEDQGAIALALRLASAIDAEDSGRTVAELAGKLLAVLESLGATPAARKAILPKGGAVNDSPARTARDELRARRSRRANGTEDLDATSS